MASLWKKGLAFIGSAIVLYVLDKIFSLIESHLTDITRFFVVPNLTIIDIISIISGIIGISTFLIDVISRLKKRMNPHSVLPIENKTGIDIVVEIKEKYWYPPEKQFNSVFYTVYIKTLLKNIGNRDTTIHTVSISFDYKGTYHEYTTTTVENGIKMYSGDSKNPSFSFNINETDIQIDSNLQDVKFTVEHTYDKVELSIREIPKL